MENIKEGDDRFEILMNELDVLGVEPYNEKKVLVVWLTRNNWIAKVDGCVNVTTTGFFQELTERGLVIYGYGFFKALNVTKVKLEDILRIELDPKYQQR